MNWVALNPKTNSICATGKRQSPINMIDGVFQMISSSDINLDIPDFTEGAVFENLGTTVEVLAQGGTLEISEIKYELRQLHFHLPSEHLDNGTSIASTFSPLLLSVSRRLSERSNTAGQWRCTWSSITPRKTSP
jgi:carbonic anhydrase